MAKFDICVWDHGSGQIKLSRSGQQTTIALEPEEQARFQLLADEIWQYRQDAIKASTVPPALADYSTSSIEEDA